MVKFKVEKFDKKSSIEIFPLLKLHKIETFKEGLLFDSIKDETFEDTNINFDLMINMSLNDKLLYVTIRNEKSELVGYSVFNIFNNSFTHNGFIISDLYGIYIKEEYRSFKNFKNLISISEKYLKIKDVKIIYMNMPTIYNNLMKRLRYKSEEICFKKEI